MVLTVRRFLYGLMKTKKIVRVKRIKDESLERTERLMVEWWKRKE